MDCSTTDVPTNVHDSPGKDSSSSDDDVPLSKLLKRTPSDEKQLSGNTRRLTYSSNANSKKDKSASDDSDDEPLIKMKTISAPAKKPVRKGNTSPRSKDTNNKKADDSSDNEPLINIAKVSSKAAKKHFSVPLKKSVDTKKKESLDDNDSSDHSSDDELLSELAKKLPSQHQRKASRKANPVMKSKRNAARKTVKYAESSSGGSDYEPHATIKRKWTKAPKELKTSSNSKKTRQKIKNKSLKDPSSSDNSSDDDDVPLVNLITEKKKPVKKNTKKTTLSQGRKRRGSSSNCSDDEPLTKAAKHPQVTKILRIILERCDGEEAGTTGSLNKTNTDTPIEEKSSSEEEGSEESPEEE
ncbi:nucleolar protein dao-5-like isoform X3 [Micropterus dolomieu]|uniref:nucleolar protein dao-5-like isoform X3 n=1 Tax=Micropterus dolomieu TaxID=147949 RepID=UPI001E8D5D3D|nr:nucleolar protein dao-5-like isoform X3 [Micropterus dolomieu]